MLHVLNMLYVKPNSKKKNNFKSVLKLFLNGLKYIPNELSVRCLNRVHVLQIILTPYNVYFYT